MPRTNPNKIIAFKIPIPTFEEQTAIAQYLDTQTQTLDHITHNLKQQIVTLKELRKTLINDVVTGKICVVEDPSV